MKRQARRARINSRVPAKSAERTRDMKSAQSPSQQAMGAIDGSSSSELAEDLLLGAVAVAKELNWKGPRGQWNVRRVYHLKSVGTLPIHNVPGLGICARRSSLRKFFSALDDRVKVLLGDTATK
jgi:hypothetical protein